MAVAAPQSVRDTVMRLRNEGAACPDIAKAVGVNRSTVRRWITESGQNVNLARIKVTDDHRKKIRELTEAGNTAREIASAVGIEIHSVRTIIKSLGLTKPRTPVKKPSDWREIAVRMIQDGRSSSEIGQAIGTDPRWTRTLLSRHGLHTKPSRERTIEKVKQALRRQLADAGVDSLAQVRIRQWKEFSKSLGWPGNLRVREVQILEALADGGLMNRRQICEAIGVDWKGARGSLHSNDKNGSYTATLMEKGLLVRSPRVRVPGRTGRGCSVHFYMLSSVAKQMKADFVSSQNTRSNNVEATVDRHTETAEVASLDRS